MSAELKSGINVQELNLAELMSQCQLNKSNTKIETKKNGKNIFVNQDKKSSIF
jgi:hypothetical protein